MAAGQMAEFFATFGFRINQTDIAKVDKQLNILEAKARRMSEQSLSNIRVNISRFSFSADFNTRLHRALKARMKVAGGKGIAPEITLRNFVVDRSALLREMKDAIRYVENNTRIRVRTGVNQDGMRGAGGAGGAGGRVGFAAGAGAGAGSAMRGAALPAVAGVFGVSKLNQVNQQLIAQKRASTAVFKGEEAGKEQLAYVRDLGNKIGFDYRSQADPYIKMAAAGTTAGMSTDGVQGVFTGMAEYSRVMGLSDEDMKGSMRAVEQMLNKGQVYSEELKMQLGEKFPAAIQIMAEAVSGGDTDKLFDMMDAGEVNSLEALPEFARLLSEKARVGGALAESMKDSSAEQARLANVFNDMVKVFSKFGFEEGQAEIFKTMAAFFKEMKPLVQAFGQAWKYVGAMLRVPLGLLADLSTGIERVADNADMAKGDVLALGTVIGLMLTPFTRFATVVFASLLVLEDFTAFLSGRGSAIGTFLREFKKNNPKEYVKTIEAIESAFRGVNEVVQMILNGWREIFKLMGSDDFSGAALKILRTTAIEIGATADALMRIMRAMGYTDPSKTDAEKLKAVQERNEAPKSSLEMARDKLVAVFKDPLGINNDPDLQSGGNRMDDVSKGISGPSVGPFLMNDKETSENYFADSQTMRIGGKAQTFINSVIGELRIDGTGISDPEELAKVIEEQFSTYLTQTSENSDQGGPN